MKTCHKYYGAEVVNVNYECPLKDPVTIRLRARTNKPRRASIKNWYKLWGAEHVNIHYWGPLADAVSSGVLACISKPRRASVKK